MSMLKQIVCGTVIGVAALGAARADAGQGRPPVPPAAPVAPAFVMPPMPPMPAMAPMPEWRRCRDAAHAGDAPAA